MTSVEKETKFRVRVYKSEKRLLRSGFRAVIEKRPLRSGFRAVIDCIGKHELEESGEPEQKEETHQYFEEVEG